MISFRIPRPTGNYTSGVDGELFVTNQKSPKGTPFVLEVFYTGRATARFLAAVRPGYRFVLKPFGRLELTDKPRKVRVTISNNDFEEVQGSDNAQDLELLIDYTDDSIEIPLNMYNVPIRP